MKRWLKRSWRVCRVEHCKQGEWLNATEEVRQVPYLLALVSRSLEVIAQIIACRTRAEIASLINTRPKMTTKIMPA